MPLFWHTIHLSLLSEYDVIWRTLRNKWLYRQENIKSSGRFFCFRKTLFLWRHCDSILTSNWSFFVYSWWRQGNASSLIYVDIICEPASLRDQRRGFTASKGCRLQKLVKRSRFVQTAKFFHKSYFNKV